MTHVLFKQVVNLRHFKLYFLYSVLVALKFRQLVLIIQMTLKEEQLHLNSILLKVSFWGDIQKNVNKRV